METVKLSSYTVKLSSYKRVQRVEVEVVRGGERSICVYHGIVRVVRGVREGK